MTDEEAKTFLDNLKVCIEEHPIVADWLVEIADRKTENSSEKPNNSDTISRQAAISAICNACGKIDCDKMDKCEKLQLPPANCSEIPNNCEHITEDGVTCARYPACDDCLDNPLNKLKGSERLVKGSEQTDLVEDSPSLVKDLVKAFGEDGTWLERQGVYTLTLAEAKQRAVDIIETVSRKDEADTPQTDCDTCKYGKDKHRYAHICNECGVGINNYTPQTDCGWAKPTTVGSDEERTD